MAYQFAGFNTVDAAPFALLMDINDNQLDMLQEDARGPVIHGMAFSLGLISLGTQQESLVEIMFKHLETPDIDA